MAFEVAVEVVVVGRHAGFTTGAKLPDREHVVVQRLVHLRNLAIRMMIDVLGARGGCT